MTLSLVTGGSGFIGQHLVDQLIADGSRVRILDIEPPARRDADIEFIQGSITDKHLVSEVMGGVSHLYHTAAIPHLWIPDPRAYYETNVVGTRIVFEKALNAGVKRIVHTSSATVLIDGMSGHKPIVLDEATRTAERVMIGHYARSKWRAEKIALSYAERLPVVVVLPTLPLGPGDHHLTPPSRMLLDFMNGESLGYADCILNIIDVRDVAAGHRFACAFGRSGQRYILNSHSLKMVDFLERLEKLTHRRMPTLKIPGSIALGVSAAMELWANFVSRRSPIAPLAGVRMGLRPVTFDSCLAKTALGLPAKPLDETLGDAVDWLAATSHLSDENQDTALAFGDQ